MPKVYQRGSHTKYDIKLHIVWITKYQYKIMTDPIKKWVRATIKRRCEQLGVEIVKGHLDIDHIQLLISLPTTVSIAKVVQDLKGYSSFEVQKQFPEL